MSEALSSCLPPGLTKHTDGGGFCQWVADHNEDSATGHDTSHVVGIIACQTQQSQSKPVKPISRTNISASEIISLPDVKIKAPKSIDMSTMQTD